MTLRAELIDMLAEEQMLDPVDLEDIFEHLEAAGFRIVPVEPSDDMIVQAFCDTSIMGVREVWSAMLAASPLAAPGGQDGR